MPLRHFYKTFFVEASALETSDLLQKSKQKMGSKLFNMAVRIFTEYVSSRTREKSGGYFHFGMILGDSGQASKKDVDYLWSRMYEIYGKRPDSHDLINRILGTICMMCVAGDPRKWAYKDDMDKQEKLYNNEIPDANEYFISDYDLPVSRDQKILEADWFKKSMDALQEKFQGKNTNKHGRTK